jgi:WD40 repeat protein
MPGFHRWLALIAATVSLCSGQAPAYLRIETGGHGAKINRIAVDAAERYLVSAADDKTVRVWELATGKALRVFRPPLGEGNEGKLYSVAITADGALVAAGGWTGPVNSNSIYLIDRQSGAFRTPIPGLPNVINHVAFSTDGRHLAATLGVGEGLRVFRVSDGAEVFRDKYGSDSYWAEFDSKGRLVTTCFDGYVRLYGPDFRLITRQQLPGGKRPFTAVFSPDGTRIAVGFDDASVVNIASAVNLQLISTLAPAQRILGLSAVAWFRDGRLIAGGRPGAGQDSSILTWNLNDKGPPAAFLAGDDTVRHIKALSGGRIAFATADPMLGVVDASGRAIWRRGPDFVKHRGHLGSLRVSHDGGLVAFNFAMPTGERRWTERSGLFLLEKRQLLLDAVEPPGLGAPRATGLAISDWKDGRARLNDRVLLLDEYEDSRALAIAPGAQTFVLSADWTLRKYDRQGQHLRAVSLAGVGWGVNISGDGRYAVAAVGDGTIRWYTMDDLTEVLALFIHRDGKRWVAWTPEGFFDASPGGEELIGYHVNQEVDREGEFVSVEQLTDVFYRPELIAQRLGPKGAEGVNAAMATIGDVRDVLAGGLPPELELLSPAESESQDGEFVLQFRVKERSGGRGRVVYRVNGVEIQARPAGIPAPGRDTVAARVPLGAGRQEVTGTMYNAKNQLESRSVTAIVNVKISERQPALFVLAAGISKYRDNALSQGVKFAAGDAEAVAAQFRQQGAGLFSSVWAETLVNEKATRALLEAKVKELAPKVKSEDVFVLYLAGHGLADDGNYLFVPWEVLYTNQEALRKASLDSEGLRALLKQIPARKTLVLLDTCDSGAFKIGPSRTTPEEKAAIARLAKISGRAVLAASGTKEMALEGHERRGVPRGVFTSVLLEALEKADKNANGRIEVTELADFIQDEVPKVTERKWGYVQSPTLELSGQSFAVARRP